MKVRNIVQIALLASLGTTGSTYCMFAAGAKAMLQKVGTIVGVGLPTAPFVTGAGQSAYQTYTDPVSQCPNTQPMPAAHEQFYREIVGDTPQLRSTPETGNAFNLGSIITMPETLHTKAGDLISLDEALKSNDHNALATFEGIIEHENRHRENKDTYTICAEVATLPVITTAVAAACFKKTVPASKTMAQHVGRFAAKVTAGVTGFEVNKEIVNRGVAYGRRKKEFAADQGISIQNRDNVMDFLDIAENTMYTAAAKQQYPDLTELDQKRIAKEMQDASHRSPYVSHPSNADRRKALMFNKISRKKQNL
jgi:hypothetical protein